MGRDEFNHVEITNDKQIRGVEFGKTSANEYFSQRENVVNKNELNRQVKDELNEGVPNSSQKERKQEGLTREEIEELNASNSSSGSTSSTVSTGSSTATSSSASSAAATASSGASAAASTAAVSASVVVVTAFTVVTATPIIVSNATAVLHNFEKSENEVFYEIELLDTIETENYRVILSSDNFQDSKPLEPGINNGEFYDLKANTEYVLSVEEGNDIEIKRTLLSKTFTTQEEYIPVSEIRGLYFGKDISFLDRSFELKIDFIDEQEIYSDFVFTLSNSSYSHDYGLAKTTEIQSFTVDSNFDLEEALNYSFSYSENGQKVIYEENSFQFNDTSGAISDFNFGSIDESANFLTGTISVTLDYQDDFDLLDDFKLVIYNEDMGVDNAQTFSLEKTIAAQSINTKAATSALDLEEGPYTYFFTYTRKGVEKESDKKEISFTDTSGAISELNDGLVSASANFLTRTIDVTLDYQDDFGILDSFKLVMYNEDMGIDNAKTFTLEKTTSSQSINVDTLDLEESPYTYFFSYLRKGINKEVEAKNITFVDTSGAVSEFNDGLVSSSANFLTRTIDVTLDYQDDFNILSDFKLVIYNEEMGVDNAKSYVLEKTTSSQSVVVDDLDLEEGPYTYFFTYKRKTATKETNTKEITFSDTSGAVSAFNDGVVDSSADFLEETFNVTIDFVDDFNVLDNIALVIYDMETGEENARTYNLSKVLTSQTLSAKAIDDLPALDLESGSFVYYFTYTRKGKSNKTELKEVGFEDSEGRRTVFNSGTIDTKADFIECEFYVQLDYIDEFDRLDNFVLHIEDTSSTFTREYPLSKVTSVQTLSANESDTDPGFDLEDGSYIYYISYTDKGVDNTTLSESVTFTDKDDRKSVFNSITINEADFSSQTFDVTLDFVDDFSRLSNFHILLTDSTKDISTEYDLDKVTTTQTFSAESLDDKDAVLDLEHSSLSYVLTYEDRGVTKTVDGDTTFTDKEGLSSGVTTFDFVKDGDEHVLMNFVTYEFDINMDFEDYFGYMSSFQLEFYRIVAEERVSYEVAVDRASGDQHLTVTDAAGFSDFFDGESVNYELTYLNISGVRETAKTGSIIFEDSSVSEITDLEVGKIKTDGYSYYIPFRIDFIDERSIYTHFAMYVENEDVAETYLVQLSDDGYTYMDNHWEYCYFSIGDISTLTAKTSTISIKDSDTSEVLYSKNFDLELDDTANALEVMGLRIQPLVSSDMPSFTVQYFAYNGDNGSDPISIKFVDSEGVEYVFDGVSITSAGASANVTVDPVAYAEFISKVNSGYTFDVYAIYPGAGGDVEVLCYTAFRFEVS